MLHTAEQFRFASSIHRRLVPAALCACLLLAAGAAAPRATRAQEGAGAQPQAPRPRTKRVTPLRKSDSAQGSRVTITSDGGALSDYSAYRSGDRFIVVIPQAEAVGGGGGVSGRGFAGAQVSKRGNDLVYTFKLEPGATARVNQRFNQLDVQFTAQKSAATPQPSATPTPTPRAQRTPAELAGLASPTPAVKATPDTTRLVSTDPNAQASGVVPPAGATVPTPAPTDVSPAFPDLTATPATTPTAAPTAEQIAQVFPTPAAPVSATVPAGAATGRTLGATVISNWPWILAALLAVGFALLFVSRRGSRRENELPPAASTPPALKERPSAKPLKVATTATTPAATATTTPAAESAAKVAAVPTVAKAAPIVAPVPVVAKETQPEPRAAEKPKKPQTKAERRREKQLKAAAEKRAAAEKTTVSGPATTEQPTAATAEIVEAKIDTPPAAKTDAPPALTPAVTLAATPDAAAVKPVVPVSAHVPAEEKGIVLGAADAEVAGAEIQKLLAGESYQESVVGATDSATRQLVGAELAAALASRNAERNGRARAAFLKHGYFEDAARDLQTAEAPAQRAAAALSLALLHDRAATPHLVAALEDPSPDVRRASIEALSQLRDPAACAPLEALRWRERSRQVPQSLIRHAIEACTPAEVEADDTLVSDDETIISESVGVAPTAAEDAGIVATPTVEAPPVAATTVEVPAVETAATDTVVDETARAETPSAETPSVETPSAETQTVEAFPLHAPAFESQPADAAALAPPAVESDSPATPAVEASAVEPSKVETPSVVEASAIEAPAVEVPSAGARAEETTAASQPEETPASGAVYTFDESETSAWASRGERPAAGTSAADLSSAGARESHPEATGTDAHVYAAPEFAVPRGAETAADEWIEVEESRADEFVAPSAAATDSSVATVTTAATEVSAVEAVSEILPEPVDDTAFVYPAESVTETRPASMRAEPAEETAIEVASEEKGVELATEGEIVESAAEKSVVEWAAAPGRTSFVEPEIEMGSPLDRDAAAPLGLALVEEEEPVRARGLSAVDDTEPEVRAGRKGLAPQGADDELSIIPKAIQLRLDSPDATERAESVLALARLNTDEAYQQICDAFDDRDQGVREAAARALYEVADDRAESFTRALREAGPERRRNIGAALSGSGLAEEAISQLTGESRDKTYDAFSLLFLMAKAGETAPLIHAIESHSDNEVRLAVVKLLALSGQQEVLPSFRRLAVRGSLPADVRAAVMEAIYQISSSGSTSAPAAPNRAN